MTTPEASTKVYLPLRPKPAQKEDPRAAMSESEQTMYDEVLQHFSKEDPPYSIANVEKGELSEQEKFWLSKETILRYLRASKWKVSVAIERIEATLKWRREFGLNDTVNAALVEPEAVTGKEVIFGYDTSGRPALYMIPSRQNTSESPRQVQHAVWMLERTIDLMEPGVETIALLINFADRGKNPSISTARTVLNILQDHYPERLGISLIINIPFLINAFFKIIMPFVDPITRQKVKFNPDVYKEGHFTADNMMNQWWNGEQDFEYVHEKYWPALHELCETRVKAWKENWRNLGAKVGISEWEYKKGDEQKEYIGGEEEDKKENNANTIAAEAPVSAQVPTPEAPTNAQKELTADPQTPLNEKKADDATAATVAATSSAVVATSGAGAVSGGSASGTDGAADGGAE
ncbi:hypothetical protein CVT24_000384 [Panaeolus cyanescens]|uniref:CRAL-TRIO domain-containing protein n=1 Tax=Panaeolus cyanescens TaxID=181874 RepID=A0A409YD14_9AGAR|nr:hypothetical protein CVT24_000384 [Panaeolus cyanescens]